MIPYFIGAVFCLIVLTIIKNSISEFYASSNRNRRKQEEEGVRAFLEGARQLNETYTKQRNYADLIAGFSNQIVRCAKCGLIRKPNSKNVECFHCDAPLFVKFSNVSDFNRSKEFEIFERSMENPQNHITESKSETFKSSKSSNKLADIINVVNTTSVTLNRCPEQCQKSKTEVIKKNWNKFPHYRQNTQSDKNTTENSKEYQSNNNKNLNHELVSLDQIGKIQVFRKNNSNQYHDHKKWLGSQNNKSRSVEQKEPLHEEIGENIINKNNCVQIHQPDDSTSFSVRTNNKNSNYRCPEQCQISKTEVIKKNWNKFPQCRQNTQSDKNTTENSKENQSNNNKNLNHEPLSWDQIGKIKVFRKNNSNQYHQEHKKWLESHDNKSRSVEQKEPLHEEIGENIINKNNCVQIHRPDDCTSFSVRTNNTNSNYRSSGINNALRKETGENIKSKDDSFLNHQPESGKSSEMKMRNHRRNNYNRSHANHNNKFLNPQHNNCRNIEQSNSVHEEKNREFVESRNDYFFNHRAPNNNNFSIRKNNDRRKGNRRSPKQNNQCLDSQSNRCSSMEQNDSSHKENVEHKNDSINCSVRKSNYGRNKSYYTRRYRNRQKKSINTSINDDPNNHSPYIIQLTHPEDTNDDIVDSSLMEFIRDENNADFVKDFCRLAEKAQVQLKNLAEHFSTRATQIDVVPEMQLIRDENNVYFEKDFCRLAEKIQVLLKNLAEYFSTHAPQIDVVPEIESEEFNFPNDDNTYASWLCSVCTFINSKVEMQCRMCQSFKTVHDSIGSHEDLDGNENKLCCPSCLSIMISEGLCTHCDFSITEQMNVNNKYNIPEIIDDFQKFDIWRCLNCTFNNTKSTANCEMCDLPKPQSKKVRHININNIANANNVLENSKCNCTQCTLSNSADFTNCQACGLIKSDALEIDCWICEKCNTRNHNTSLKCSACRSDKFYKMIELIRLDDVELVENTEIFECAICFTETAPTNGVILKDCLHQFCKDCLARTIETSDTPEVRCPYAGDDCTCASFLLDCEIRALVSEDVYDLFTLKSLNLAENQSQNAYHCKTPNCPWWCILDEDELPTELICPNCEGVNCLKCEVVHTGITCFDYETRIDSGSNDPIQQLSEKHLNEIIQNGNAMRCPACRAVIMKIDGCDAIQCTSCRRDLCWATKGLRWGPNGNGDNSGGCNCRVNGQMCHPTCTGCH